MVTSFEFGGTSRFQVRRRLGAGGMGVVYEAHDRERDELVALKTLRDPDPQALYRLKSEFRGLTGLHHPNLVRLGELVEADGVWFFTMELVRGVDFLRWIRRGDDRGREQLGNDSTVPGEQLLDEPRLRDGFAQLGRGLQALHGAGKVHRDLKPSNILVSGGRVVILDFGLILETADRHDSFDAQVVGTAAYMAPEQAAMRPVGPPADWYAAGVMLYEALTGQLPFFGSSMHMIQAKLEHQPPPASRLCPVPADLDLLCNQLLTYEPDARPGAEEVIARVQGNLPATDSSASLTQAPPFVGRAHELNILESAFARRARGWETVAVVGESGVGKSALIRAFNERVVGAWPDAVVLAGRCYERESVPFKAFDGLIDRLSHYLRNLADRDANALLPRHPRLLPRVFPVLARVEAISQSPARTPILDGEELRTRAFDALRELLARLAERRPVVLVIDDFQWADADSRLLLSELARRPESPALLLLLTARSSVRDLPWPTTEIQLGPLDREDAVTLAQVLCRRAQVRQSAFSVALEARGHPLYIDELVRHVALSGPSPHQPRLEEAIRERAGRLSPAAQQLLELVCIAAAPLPQEVVGSAARSTGGDLDRLVGVLRAGNLVRLGGGRLDDTIEPYHDRVREAVLAEIAEPLRVEHHHRLSVALETSSLAASHPELLLHHLEAAGQSAKAAAHARRAGERSVSALAFDQAAAFFVTALRLDPTLGEDRRQLHLAAARALAAAGRGAEAADQFLQAAVDGDQAIRLACQEQAAEQLLITGHIEPGLAAIASLLAEAGTRLPASPRRALLSLLWCRARLRIRGLRWKAQPASRIAPEELVRLDVHRAVAFGLANVDTIRAAMLNSHYLLRALEVGEAGHVGRAMGLEAIAVGTQGEPARARAEARIAQVKVAAQATGSAYLHAFEVVARGFLEFLTGRFRDAAEHLAAAEQRLVEETVGTTWERNTTRLFRCLALRWHGSLSRARELSEAYLRDALRRGDRYMATTLGLNGVFLELAAGRLEDARGRVRRLDWVPPQGEFHTQHFYELESRCDLALYEGTAGAALAATAPQFDGLNRSLLPRVQIVRALGRWQRAKLVVAAARSGDRTMLEDAERLARSLEGERVGYAGVWAALLRAGIASRRGQPEVAAAGLRAAVAGADSHELRLHAAAARHRLGQLVGGDEGAALRAAAEAWMQGQHIAEPALMLEVVAPGFAGAV